MQHKTLCEWPCWYNSGVHIEFEWIRKGMHFQINNLQWLFATWSLQTRWLVKCTFESAVQIPSFSFILILGAVGCGAGFRWFCLEDQMFDMSTVIHQLNLSWCGHTVAQSHFLFPFLTLLVVLLANLSQVVPTNRLCLFGLSVFVPDVLATYD